MLLNIQCMPMCMDESKIELVEIDVEREERERFARRGNRGKEGGKKRGKEKEEEAARRRPC